MWILSLMILFFVHGIYSFPSLEKIKYVWDSSKEDLEHIFDDEYYQKEHKQEEISHAINEIKKIVEKKIEQQKIDKKNAEVLSRLIVRGLSEDFNVYTEQNPLTWCECIPPEKRILCILTMLEDIKKKYKNLNRQLTYTSFASGNLLQDYLILSELLRDYTNVHINLIDVAYPDQNLISEIKIKSKILEAAEAKLFEGKIVEATTAQLVLKKRQADTIDLFKARIEKSILHAIIMPIKVYNNAYVYLADIQLRRAKKSDVLVMADPYYNHYPSDGFKNANVLHIWHKQYLKPIFIVYLPHSQKIRIDRLNVSLKDKAIDTLERKFIEKIRQVLSNFIYTSELIESLQQYALPNSKKYFSSLIKHFEFIQVKMRYIDLHEPYLDVEELERLDKELESYYTTHDMFRDIPTQYRAVKINTDPVLFSWMSDSMISFQDLVAKAISDGAIVYTLYQIDPTQEEDIDTSIIRKIDPERFKTEDIITPFSSTFYNSKHGYTRVVIPEKQEETTLLISLMNLKQDLQHLSHLLF